MRPTVSGWIVVLLAAALGGLLLAGLRAAAHYLHPIHPDEQDQT